MQRLGFTLIALGMLHITGLDLAIAQIDAWNSMLQERYQEGLVHAVSSTFSGTQPCQKCAALKKERSKRKSPLIYSLSLEKFKHALPSRIKPLICNWVNLSSHRFFEVSLLYDSIVLEFITPPPRRVS